MNGLATRTERGKREANRGVRRYFAVDAAGSIARRGAGGEGGGPSEGQRGAEIGKNRCACVCDRESEGCTGMGLVEGRQRLPSRLSPSTLAARQPQESMHPGSLLPAANDPTFHALSPSRSLSSRPSV